MKRVPKLAASGLLAAAAACGALPAAGSVMPDVLREPPAGQRSQERDTDNPIRGNEITPEQQRAVERGLAFLAARQEGDGSFASAGGGGSKPAITSLAAIAFMSGGNVPGRGRYGEQVRLASEYILSCAQPSGLLSETEEHGVMYAHGFATLFLAEVYGMTGDDRVKDPLTRAVRLIERSQNAEGGWRYTPAPFEADISVTITQVMALRAARDAGIKVDRGVIERAIRYVQSLQNPDGGFNYRAGPGNNSAFPRSAAGVATLFYAGIWEGPEIEAGLAYIERFRPDPDVAPVTPYYYYAHYYAVQATFLAGGQHWGAWYPAIREELIAQQNPDGSWNAEPVIGADYCTAMALIVLQMPNRYLPVFSGKGAGA